jgi:hypothetical protein
MAHSGFHRCNNWFQEGLGKKKLPPDEVWPFPPMPRLSRFMACSQPKTEQRLDQEAPHRFCVAIGLYGRLKMCVHGFIILAGEETALQRIPGVKHERTR